MKLLFTCIGLSFLVTTAIAQRQDTTYLHEIVIYGLPINQYTAGSKVEKIPVGDGIATLGDALTGETSWYLKTYGNAQLTTVSLRGTTSSQTAVFWNGININSPTLGQTDFSLMPLFLLDEVSVHYGNAGALYGSDAIGGSVMLGQSASDFVKSFRLSLYQNHGSFGKIGTGLKVGYGNTRVQLRTKAFRSFIRNDFPYFSPAVGYPKKQKHASVENMGLDQQIQVRISDRQLVTGELMYTDNFREIQPAVTNDQANETLRDVHVRAAINYIISGTWANIRATTAYLFSDQDYTDDLTSTVKSTQLSAQVSVDKNLSYRSGLRFGVNYNHYVASADNFDNARENRQDLFISYRYVMQRWILDFNARQAVYNKRYAPFAPSIGSEVQLVRTKTSELALRSQVALGFRVPTINDRYWNPGGNPFLKPEDAINAECGLRLSQRYAAFKLKLETNYYQSWIDRMIVWMPGDDGIWSPSNLQRVNVRGFEFASQLENVSKPLQITGGASYSFTQSLNKTELSSGDRSAVDKQLPYIPLHNANVFLSFAHKGWKLDTRYSYTGLRHTTLDNADFQSLKAYGLADISLSTKIIIDKIAVTAKGEAKNVTNTYYENLRNRAMPGRNYSISLFINFKPLNEK